MDVLGLQIAKMRVNRKRDRNEEPFPFREAATGQPLADPSNLRATPDFVNYPLESCPDEGSATFVICLAVLVLASSNY
jgi:hypothetical protein